MRRGRAWRSRARAGPSRPAPAPGRAPCGRFGARSGRDRRLAPSRSPPSPRRRRRAGGAPGPGTRGPLIQRDSPDRVAMRPSRVAASLSGNERAPALDPAAEAAVLLATGLGRARPRARPRRRAAAARARRRGPGGLGSRSPIKTRPMPAEITAAVHGGVRPWWLHGSSVTARVAPRSARAPCRRPARARARRSRRAVRPRGRVHPRPSTRSPRNTTAPTGGFGKVRPDARRAWAERQAHGRLGSHASACSEPGSLRRPIPGRARRRTRIGQGREERVRSRRRSRSRGTPTRSAPPARSSRISSSSTRSPRCAWSPRSLPSSCRRRSTRSTQPLDRVLADGSLLAGLLDAVLELRARSYSSRRSSCLTIFGSTSSTPLAGGEAPPALVALAAPADLAAVAGQARVDRPGSSRRRR